MGIHRDPADLVRTLRELRRKVDITTEVGVVHDIRLQELRLYTDYGQGPLHQSPTFSVQIEALCTTIITTKLSRALLH